jgi:hypothetical protein
MAGGTKPSNARSKEPPLCDPHVKPEEQQEGASWACPLRRRNAISGEVATDQGAKNEHILSYPEQAFSARPSR